MDQAKMAEKSSMIAREGVPIDVPNSRHVNVHSVEPEQSNPGNTGTTTQEDDDMEVNQVATSSDEKIPKAEDSAPSNVDVVEQHEASGNSKSFGA